MAKVAEKKELAAMQLLPSKDLRYRPQLTIDNTALVEGDQYFEEMRTELKDGSITPKTFKYTHISDAISWNNENLLTKALRHKHLDLTHEDGKFFNLAVDVGNVKIVSMLIDYFFDNPPARYSHNTPILIQNALRTQLRDILEIAAEDVYLSKEMKQLLSEYTYIDMENEDDYADNTTSETKSDDEQDLSDFDIETHTATLENNDEELLDNEELKMMLTESSTYCSSTTEVPSSYLVGQAAEADSP